MPVPTSIEALTIIALVIAPGYILLWVMQQAIQQSSQQSDIEVLVSTVAAGVVVNTIVFPLLGRLVLRNYQNGTLLNHVWLITGWAALTIFLVPVGLGLGSSWLINRYSGALSPIGLDPVSRVPHAWDYALRRPEGYYVQVWLKNDQVVAGIYADDSFASTDRDRADLFLQQSWILDGDGDFWQPIPNSAGVWISHDCISRIEFSFPRRADNEPQPKAETNEVGS